MKNITYISAGAGSGKTTRIIDELVEALKTVRPSEIMMTTFTRAAAQEMQERAKQKLLENGQPDKANEMGAATIGTIHSICLGFLQKYWYLVGLSPDIQEMDENDFNAYVDLSLFGQVSEKDMQLFEQWRKELNLKHNNKGGFQEAYVSYWRDWLRQMVDKVRYYHIDDLESSRQNSVAAIQDVFRRHMFNQTEYDGFKQAFIDALPRKKDKSLKSPAISRLAYLNDYNPVDADGKVDIKPLTGCEKEYDDWAIAAGKGAFNQDKERIAIDVVNKLFDILAQWREEYQCYKLSHRMLDFNDMEVYFCKLLEKEEVKEAIRGYKLVLVDEFQDCNPMQVDIFSRISDLVPRSIWVGDPKQAIYGFRGTDTTLVKEVSDQIVDGQKGCHRDTTDTNFRSRPELVEYVNQEFEPIFTKVPFSLQPKEIVLNAGRESTLTSPYLQTWTIFANGRTKDYSVIAANIKQLVEGGQTYVKPKDQPERLAQYGDIAILVRTNGTVAKMMQALRKFGIPYFAIEDSDKANEPVERKLLMTLAQYKLSPRYRPHLRADILHLLKDMSTEELLEDYFDHVSVDVNEEGRHIFKGRDEWKTEDELIAKIDSISEECYTLSLYDTLTVFVDRLRLYDVVAKWGDEEIRRNNISIVLRLAQDFDHHCEVLELVKPSYADFAKYMADAKAKTELNLSSPSVKILTMHKSKGLEWPIVIYCNVDNDFTADDNIVEREFFGIREQRLEDRSYWLRVFPVVASCANAYYHLYNEPYAIASKLRVSADEERLRYVSLTRARDMLVLIDADSSAEVLDPDESKQTYTLIDTSKTQKAGDGQTWLINPSENKVSSTLRLDGCASVVPIHLPADRQEIPMHSIGTCIHNIYAAYDAAMSEEQALELAQTIIGSFNHPAPMAQVLNPQEVITAIRSLYTYLTEHYGKPTRIGHEVPFTLHRTNGQLLRGEIDLLWHTPDGVVLVDFKNTGDADASPMHYAPQMEAYREAIKAAGLTCKSVVLFFATLGQIIELK